METFYFLFEPSSDTFAQWIQGGLFRGFMILCGLSFVLAAIYYLLLGKISGKHSKNSRWFLFMIINCLLVFICSIAVTNSVIEPAEENTILGISQDVWRFSILNGTLYAIFSFLVLSLILNNFSVFSKYIPFNLFKHGL